MEEQPSAADDQCCDNHFQHSCRTSGHREHFIRCTKGIETNTFGADIVGDTTFTVKAGLIGSRRKTKFLWMIHPAATFPLIVSSAIAVQGVIFLGVQGSGLARQLSDQCRAISQIVWPCMSYSTMYVHPLTNGSFLACGLFSPSLWH